MEIRTKRFDNVGETLQMAVLDNGLHVCVVPKKGFSSFFACFGTYYGSVQRSFDLAGVRHDTPAGVAHYLEHKMFDMPDGDNALQSMTATGADELHGPSFKITWKPVTSSRLDSKALKAAAPELWDRFTKATTSRRFVLSA